MECSAFLVNLTPDGREEILPVVEKMEVTHGTGTTPTHRFQVQAR